MAEVIVIGAGAAGLAAAAELARAGLGVLVLEARERIGGRCWTRRFPATDAAIELGAEFVHGPAPATYALLAQARARAIASGRRQRCVENGRLRPVDAFGEARKAMRNTTRLAARDMSFAAFLSSQVGLSPRTRRLARMMVEGFDAADPRRASARAIAAEWAGGSIQGTQPRPQGGYGPLLEWLARRGLAAGARLKLGAEVQAVRHGRGAVQVFGRFLGAPFRERAPRVVVTLPLGVLKAGAVQFTPVLAEKRRALEHLAAGPVVKAALRFAEPFWERRHLGVDFFHSPRAAFPTFWTLLSQRTPVLIGWAGGPKASRLAGLASEALARTALGSLRSIFEPVPEPDAVLVQDWQGDPFARGAYSYELVGAEDARRELAEPVGGCLWLAGEATDWEGESGTVAGALASGLRVAREILAAR